MFPVQEDMLYSKFNNIVLDMYAYSFTLLKLF